MRYLILGLNLLLLLMLSGCTSLGPDYTRPEAAVESNWLEVEEPRITSEPSVDPQWWKTAFHEPEQGIHNFQPSRPP